MMRQRVFVGGALGAATFGTCNAHLATTSAQARLHNLSRLYGQL